MKAMVRTPDSDTNFFEIVAGVPAKKDIGLISIYDLRLRPTNVS